MPRTKKERPETPPVVEIPEELTVEGAIGRAPTQDELRNLVWRFVTMEDVREVIVTIVQDAKDGKPTAMGLAVHLLGLDVEGDSRQKSPAEGILEKIRDIIALQKFPSLSLNLNLPPEELYSGIIRGEWVERPAPELGDTMGGQVSFESVSVPRPWLSPDSTSTKTPL